MATEVTRQHKYVTSTDGSGRTRFFIDGAEVPSPAEFQARHVLYEGTTSSDANASSEAATEASVEAQSAVDAFAAITSGGDVS